MSIDCRWHTNSIYYGMIETRNDSISISHNDVPPNLICFSHLRWNFVYQRPQHLLARFANHFNVFYFEEPVFTDDDDRLVISQTEDHVQVIVPHLKHGNERVAQRQESLIMEFFETSSINRYWFWYYTPMALAFSAAFKPELVVYDCMDELSAFKFAPPEMKKFEQDLLNKADLVFTGGHSLYEAKKNAHHSIYPFPSSIDKDHFAQARQSSDEPEDQRTIASPRFGFYGVIDERMDIDLLASVAGLRPHWQFVLIGPIVKIDPASLPKHQNIHYLGSKTYRELPRYLSGWDIALIPFARNESTQFISPTKTPEYLMGGKPVISTSIQDVIEPYGNKGLVEIADTAEQFIAAAERILSMKDRDSWLKKVDTLLATNSWSDTWSRMMKLIEDKFREKQLQLTNKKKEKEYV